MNHLNFRGISVRALKAKHVFAADIIIVLGFISVSVTSKESMCSSDMVPVPGHKSCIDIYEWPNIAGMKPGLGMSALPEASDKTKVKVFAIEKMCEYMGKRVCSMDEWVAACKGDKGARFPWGNERPSNDRPHPCNTDKKWMVPDEMKVHLRDPIEFSRLDQSEPSGERLECVSASGVHDMTGNVEEWVRCPGIGDYGWCLMGRFWSAVWECDRAVTTHSPHWHYYETGGRCCSDMR